MNKEVRHGKWLQVSGKAKRAFGNLVGNDDLTSKGEADIVAGAIEESYGVAKQKAVDGISTGVDRFAAATKRVARSI